MDESSNSNTFPDQFNGGTRRNYLRAMGLASLSGLSLSATMGQAGAASDLAHTLTVAANGPYSSYTVTVSGDLEAKEGIAGRDEISGSTATGAVSGSGLDSYAFSGVISALDVTGNATVYLDGEPVDTSLEHTLVVEATGSYSSYSFSVTGDVGARQGIAGKDAISGSTATGAVGGDGLDSYGFSGELETIDVDGNANVYLDGEPLNSSLEHTLAVEATGSYSRYNFSVSGDLEAKAGIAGIDRINGSTASGAVSGSGRDVYSFSGAITDLSVDGSANVFLDGELLDTTLEHTLMVEATGSYSRYEFSVTGAIGSRQDIAGRDSISGSAASGAVGGNGRDAYGFSGTITDLSVDGSADVFLDGEPLDTNHEHTLMVEATGSYSSYEFSVSGDISSRQGIAGKDIISGSTATGAVGGNGRDSYGFSGEITDLSVDGDANIYKNGDQIGPESPSNADLKLGYNARDRSHDRGNTYENFADLSGWEAERGRLVSNEDWDGNDGGCATLVGTTSESRIRMAADFNSANFAYRDPSVAVRLRGPANETLRVELWADTSDDQFVTSRYLSEKHDWIRLPISPTAINGRPDLADIDRVTIECYTGGKDIRIDVDDIRTARKRDSGAVLFIFDDGNETDYTVAYDELTARGWAGSSAVIPALIGGRGNLSRSQMDEMYANGWAFPNHPQGDTRADGLGSVSSDRAEDMMRENKRWLLDNGYERGADTIVWPFGDFNHEALQIAGDYYRLAWGGGSSTANGTVTEAGWVPRVDLNEGNDVANALDAIDYAHRTDTVLSFKTHGMGGNNIGRADFNRVLDQIEKRDLDVLTTSDFAAEQ